MRPLVSAGLACALAVTALACEESATEKSQRREVMPDHTKLRRLRSAVPDAGALGSQPKRCDDEAIRLFYKDPLVERTELPGVSYAYLERYATGVEPERAPGEQGPWEWLVSPGWKSIPANPNAVRKRRLSLMYMNLKVLEQRRYIAVFRPTEAVLPKADRAGKWHGHLVIMDFHQLRAVCHAPLEVDLKSPADEDWKADEAFREHFVKRATAALRGISKAIVIPLKSGEVG